MVLGIAHDRNASAVRLDDVALRHGVDGVVRPLAVHVGPDRLEQRSDSRLRKDDDVVRAAKRGDQFCAIGGGED